MSVIEPGAQPEDLIPGDPDALDRLAARLREFSSSAADAVTGVRRLDSSHWSGIAAERFRDSIQQVPAQLQQAQHAFRDAQRTVHEHAVALRQGQQSASHAIELTTEAHQRTRAWLADGAVGPDPGADDRERAERILARAQDQVQTAARKAARQLTELARQAPAPAAEAVVGRMPTVRSAGMTIRASMEHPLQDPDSFADRTGDSTTDLRYGSAHHVGFADGTSGSPGSSWDGWVDAGSGRETGSVSEAVTSEMGLSGLGMTAMGLGVLGVGGRPRRRRRTAMSVAGIELSGLHPTRRARTGSIGGVPARVGSGAAAMWRTNRAEPPQGGRLPPPTRGTSGRHAAGGAPVVLPLDR
ncbi:MAG TPA: hypothetical protein VHC49_23800, partial [Mycobacteriales bacterium]|nr:hypothetical protein [Mycobacteriales bacterium]